MKILKNPKEAKNLLQVISNHFDCDVSTPNGLKQTHALATTVCTKDVNTLKNTEIPRLKQSALPSVPPKGEKRHIYTGEKKNAMPIDLLGHQENSLVSHCMDVFSLHEWEQSSEKNLRFMIDSISSNESTPDFQGYNHKGIHRDCANKGKNYLSKNV